MRRAAAALFIATAACGVLPGCLKKDVPSPVHTRITRDFRAIVEEESGCAWVGGHGGGGGGERMTWSADLVLAVSASDVEVETGRPRRDALRARVDAHATPHVLVPRLEERIRAAIGPEGTIVGRGTHGDTGRSFVYETTKTHGGVHLRATRTGPEGVVVSLYCWEAER